MTDVFSVHFRPRTWLIRATILAVSLSLLHMLATPLYFEAWLGYGVFFFTVALAEVAHSMALAVIPPNRSVLWLGIAGNALIFILWVITRTVGIPLFGSMAGEVLPVGFLDGLTQVLIIVQIVHLAVLLATFDELGNRALVE
jgi:hypothetical protein